MKLIIAGSRRFNDYELLCWFMDRLIIKEPLEVISGCAKGADTLGEKWAESYGIYVTRFPADWDKYGKAAGPVRNKQMADYADVLVAFVEKGSKGTLNMITTAAKKPMEIHVCPF